MDTIKLTKTVKKGGCAAKVAAQTLREMLQNVSFPPTHSEVLVDGSSFDDAAVYQVSDEVALVQTLDFFTPIVNDAYAFGRIAAANALSDVYAMGGEPKTCLAILAFPVAALPIELGARILQGASDVIAEAGATFVGGHSIDDETLKFGLSVTGYVHPKKIWTNAGAREGDVLILTKPLGTGTLLAGLKSEAYAENQIGDALESMATLNRVLPLLREAALPGIHAATDVTGFGLAGHAMQMARASGKSFDVETRRLPKFERTIESLEQSFLTKAHTSNREYTADGCSFSGVSDVEKLVVFDPQTSGGLLLSVEKSESAIVLADLQKSFSFASIVGTVTASGEVAVRFA